MSGILQQGYSLGYVFAACANLGVGGETETYKTVFWIAGALYNPSQLQRYANIYQPESPSALVSSESSSPNPNNSSRQKQPASALLAPVNSGEKPK
jgi:hypothetical protein